MVASSRGISFRLKNFCGPDQTYTVLPFVSALTVSLALLLQHSMTDLSMLTFNEELKNFMEYAMEQNAGEQNTGEQNDGGDAAGNPE